MLLLPPFVRFKRICCHGKKASKQQQRIWFSWENFLFPFTFPFTMLTVTFNFVINSNAFYRFFTSFSCLFAFFFFFFFSTLKVRIHTNRSQSLWQTQRIIDIKITYFPFSPQKHLVPVTFHSLLNRVCFGNASFFVCGWPKIVTGTLCILRVWNWNVALNSVDFHAWILKKRAVALFCLQWC